MTVLEVVLRSCQAKYFNIFKNLDPVAWIMLPQVLEVPF